MIKKNKSILLFAFILFGAGFYVLLTNFIIEVWDNKVLKEKGIL